LFSGNFVLFLFCWFLSIVHALLWALWMEQHCCMFPVSHAGFKGECELIDCWLLWCRQSCPSLSVSQWSCHFQCHSDMEIIKQSQKWFTLLLQHPLWKMFVLLLTHLMWLSACWSSLWGFATLTLDLFFFLKRLILKLWHMIKQFSVLAKKVNLLIPWLFTPVCHGSRLENTTWLQNLNRSPNTKHHTLVDFVNGYKEKLGTTH